MSRQVAVLLTIAAWLAGIASEAGCETSGTERLRAEVPDGLVSRVMNDAQRLFARRADAPSSRTAPEELALAYWRSNRRLAAVARADGLSSHPTVVAYLRDAMTDELRRRLFKRLIGDIPIRETDIRAYYDSHVADYRVKGQFRIRFIFLNVVDNPGKEKEKEIAAANALAAIKAGTPFEQVAQKFSDEENRKGALQGPIPYGEIDPDLETRIVALQQGQVTDVVRSKWGYNIFRLEQIERPTTRTLDEARDSIVEELRRRESGPAYDRFVAQLNEKYPVKKRYEVLNDPKAPDSAVVADAAFLKIAVGDYRKRLAESPGPERPQLDDAAHRSEFLDSWIDEQRIAHAATEAGLPQDPEVQAVRRYLADKILALVYLDGLRDRLPAPGEQAVRKYYDDHRAEYVTKPAETRLREIVLSCPAPEGSDNMREYYLARKKARTQADEIAAKLKAGADVAALVRQYSAAASAKKDGDTGFIVPGRRNPALGKALAALEIGQWTGPIDETDAISIFQLLERKAEVVAPLDDLLKASIESGMQQERWGRLCLQLRTELGESSRRDLSVEAIRKIVDSRLTKRQ